MSGEAQSSEAGTAWMDIDDFLQRASAALPLGGMVHDSSFNLFATISAIEIGNARMDFGAAASKIGGEIPTVDQMIESGAAPTAMTSAQLVALCDRMLTMEALWHDGHALSHTIATCIYLHRLPRTRDNALLHAICCAALSTCDLIRSLLSSAHVCDDEDCNLHLFGVPTGLLGKLDCLSDTTGLNALESALGVLSTLPAAGNARRPQHTQHVSSAGKRGSESQTNSTTEGSAVHDAQLAALTATDIDALECRLKFRHALHCCLRSMLSMQSSVESLQDAARHAAEALNMLSAMDSTHSIGAELYNNSFGFSPHIASALILPVPPRAIVPLSWQDTVAYFTKLLDDISAACGIVHCASLQDIVLFLSTFSARCAGSIARSALHYQVMIRGKVEEQLPPWSPSRGMLMHSMRMRADVLQRSTNAVLFIEQAGIAFSNWCQVMLLNRARCRRRLRRGLEDWLNMYHHACAADACADAQSALQSTGWQLHCSDEAGSGMHYGGPMALFIEKHTALCMAQHLQLGFELDLYQIHEYGMVFWYLNYLYGVAMQACKRLHSMRPRNAAADDRTKRKKSAKLRAATKHTAPLPADAADAQQQFVELARYDAERCMCEAMMYMLHALYMAAPRYKAQHDTWFNGECEIFELRFRSFYTIEAPPHLTYEQYVASTSAATQAPNHLFATAAAYFSRATKTLDAIISAAAIAAASSSAAKHSMPASAAADDLKNLKDMQRVCLQNSIACNVFCKSLAAGRMLDVSFDTAHHRFYPVMRAKVAAAAPT